MELAIVDTKNKKVGSLEVSEDVFGADINEHILHEVVVMQLANKRRGTAVSTKSNGSILL